MNKNNAEINSEADQPDQIQHIPQVPEPKNGSTRALDEEIWFHGVLPRGEVVRLLVTDGDFLVRETVRNDEKQIVLSVMWTSPRHFIGINSKDLTNFFFIIRFLLIYFDFAVQTSPEGLYRFEGPGFATVQELIMHQYHSGLPVTSRSGAILKTPIAREDWELNNDDVQLVDKVCIFVRKLVSRKKSKIKTRYLK